MLREYRLGTAQADLRRARDTGRTGSVEVDVVGGITGLILGVLVTNVFVTTQGRAVGWRPVSRPPAQAGRCEACERDRFTCGLFVLRLVEAVEVPNAESVVSKGFVQDGVQARHDGPALGVRRPAWTLRHRSHGRQVVSGDRGQPVI